MNDAGELKHGTIALIEEHQSVIALCCNEDIMEKTMNNIVEVKTRGHKCLMFPLRIIDKLYHWSMIWLMYQK